VTLRLPPALLLPAFGLLAACASDPGAAPLAAQPLTPTEQYAIELVPTTDEILLAPHGALSANQGAALSALAQRWREAGEGPVVVQAAAAGPARDTAMQAVQALQAFGVPAQSVELAPSAPATGAQSAPPAGPPEPVRVAFERLAAVIPHCGGQWGDLTRTGGNLPYAGFGCAVTGNMAAQIADPRDLAAPRPGAPADAERRAAVLDKYRKGEATATRTDDADRGVVSRAIQ